jgi:hypothetical protein
MAVATATAIGLGIAAASTATQVYGAKKAAGASKQAAKDQTAATDRASGMLDQVWGPYVNAGRQSISAVSRLTTPPAGSRYAAPDPTMGPRPPQAPPSRPRGGMPQTGTAVPRTLGGLAQGGMAPGGPGGPPPAQPMFVQMRAPNGEIERVPAHLEERFAQMGATRVG